jgi:hypothetical protein
MPPFPAERVSNEFGGDSFPQPGEKISNSISSALKRWHIAVRECHSNGADLIS